MSLLAVEAIEREKFFAFNKINEKRYAMMSFDRCFEINLDMKALHNRNLILFESDPKLFLDQNASTSLMNL